MMGHKICFYGEMWLIISVTPSYLEHWGCHLQKYFVANANRDYSDQPSVLLDQSHRLYLLGESKK